MRYVVSTSLAIALGACGGGDGPSDAGATSDGSSDAGGIAPPEVPWRERGVPPATFTPCPDGWREVARPFGVTTCEPYPEGGPEECVLGEAHFAGEPGCRTIGDPCPSGDFGVLPSEGPIVYVRAGAAPDTGDGSLASPYGALSEVRWTSLAPGTTVALARGTYEGAVPLRAGVSVLGACVAETVLTGVDAPVLAVITVTSSGEPAVVRGLRFSGPPQPAARVEAGRSLRVEAVLVEGGVGEGFVANGSDALVTLDEVVVRGTRANDVDFGGSALSARLGGRIVASRVFADDNEGSGILAYDGGSLDLDGVTVLRTRATVSDLASGIFVDGGTLEGRRLYVAENGGLGVASTRSGTGHISDAVVRDNVATAGALGAGLTARMMGRLDAERVVVDGSFITGAWVDEDSDMTLEDAILERSRPSPAGSYGRGAIVQFSRFTARRVVITDNRDVGLFIGTAQVEIEDVVVRDTLPLLSDETISGMGIAVLDPGASLVASRTVLADDRYVGLLVTGGATATLRDFVVENVRTNSDDVEYGWGMVAGEGAVVDAERLAIEHVVGVGAISSNATLQLRDTTIRDVPRAPCVTGACAGFGVASVATGSLDMERFEIREAATCGVFVADEAGADLRRGLITASTIGACVQIDGYDLDRLTAGVSYVDNEANLETTALPVPEPPDPF